MVWRKSTGVAVAQVNNAERCALKIQPPPINSFCRKPNAYPEIIRTGPDIERPLRMTYTATLPFLSVAITSSP